MTRAHAKKLQWILSVLIVCIDWIWAAVHMLPSFSMYHQKIVTKTIKYKRNVKKRMGERKSRCHMHVEKTGFNYVQRRDNCIFDIFSKRRKSNENKRGIKSGWRKKNRRYEQCWMEILANSWQDLSNKQTHSQISISIQIICHDSSSSSFESVCVHYKHVCWLTYFNNCVRIYRNKIRSMTTFGFTSFPRESNEPNQTFISSTTERKSARFV